MGNTFTVHTFHNVQPYLLNYTLLTLLLIGICMVNAYLVSKWVKVDMTTSMLGSIPGGLSAVTALSESMKANTGLVTIFQTIRLISILFIIPFAATHFFLDSSVQTAIQLPQTEQGAWWTIVLYVTMYILARLTDKFIPSSLVIVPMLLTAVLQVSGMQLYQFPHLFFVLAQLTIGVYLGHSISIRDLKKAGRLCLYYTGLSLLLILLSFGLGYLFSLTTSLNMATSILSMAPGGLVEMALTAQTTGGDPSIVSSLQTIRLLLVVLVVPLLLQWTLPKLEKHHRKEES
nr:AbrB family transcriptional regulator [Terribacillus aidingensis]